MASSKKKFDWSAKSIAKIFGFVLLAGLGILILIGIFASAFRMISGVTDRYSGNYGYLGEMTEEAYYADEYDGDFAVSALSSLSYPIPDPSPEFTPGVDVESFEVRRYNGSISTRNLEADCGRIFELKEREYIIFETSDQNEDNCYYRFKVEKGQETEALNLIESLDPEYLNENVTSIKRSFEGVETELNILQKRLTAIEETLQEAQLAYDEISQIAADQQNADALASVIDSKLNLIERLSNEQLNTKAQIDRFYKQRQELTDQLNFTFFDISLYKDVVFDWEYIKNSWKAEARDMISDLNGAIQFISLRFLTFTAYTALGLIYLFVMVFVVKFAWRGVRRIWKS